MKKKLIAISTVFALSVPLANAMVLNPRGTGQVLLYPYYTVNGGNNTLLTIGNSTPLGKAIRVRFLESFIGREVLSFNLYLAPYDVWTSAIFPIDNTNPNSSSASLVTDDNSCTVPAIKTSTTLPQLPDLRHYVPFSNFAYTDANDDGGPNYLSRTREGMIEVIEMGTVSGFSTLISITQDQTGTPKNCKNLENAWAEGGYWKIDPTKDLSNPTGGLFGNAQIINVTAGTMWSHNAVALEEFRRDPTDSPRGSKSSVVLHTTADNSRPNLRDALTDPAKKLASASVLVEDRMIRVDYPADTQAIDAVSAVLMADTLSNDYVVSPSIGAQSEWVLAFPTRGFYTDEAEIGSQLQGIAPFYGVFPGKGWNRDEICEKYEYKVSNREASRFLGSVTFLPPSGWPPGIMGCFVVQTVLMQGGINSFLGSKMFAPFTDFPSANFWPEGWMTLLFDHTHHSLRPALDGTVFHGLPAIGFLATNYVNSNVQNGVLANYSGTFPHRTTVKCTKNGNDC